MGKLKNYAKRIIPLVLVVCMVSTSVVTVNAEDGKEEYHSLFDTLAKDAIVLKKQGRL